MHPPDFNASSSFDRAFARGWRTLLLVFWLPLAIGQTNDDEASDIYRVKAGYLFNFLRFADWPVGTLPAQAPLHVAVAADVTTFQLIADTLFNKVVNGHPVIVEHPAPISVGPLPQLFFLTQTASPADHALAAWYGQSPVLTIGETAGFARQGGILNFVIVDGSVRFEVNLAAAQRAGLRISSRLSKLAILIPPE